LEAETNAWSSRGPAEPHVVQIIPAAKEPVRQAMALRHQLAERAVVGKKRIAGLQGAGQQNHQDDDEQR